MSTLVCLKLSRSALASMHNNLYTGEEHVVTWGAEEKALLQYKKYGDNWADKKGHSGKWVQPTHRHTVTLTWRFLGVENNLPVYEIGLVECKRITKQRLVLRKTLGKLRHGIIILIGLLGLLTVLLQTSGNLSVALEPFWEFIVTFATLGITFFHDR